MVNPPQRIVAHKNSKSQFANKKNIDKDDKIPEFKYNNEDDINLISNSQK